MNRFDDIVERVSLLNQQLASAGRDLHLRKCLHSRLWELVGYLDSFYGLGLDNHCVDLSEQAERLIIRFYESSENRETNIVIMRNGHWERYSEPLLIDQHDCVPHQGQSFEDVDGRRCYWNFADAGTTIEDLERLRLEHGDRLISHQIILFRDKDGQLKEGMILKWLDT